MKITIIDRGSPYYEDALALRYSLFFEKYNLPREVLFDEDESTALHCALVEVDELIAYGRLNCRGDSLCQISQMVVDPQYQNRGYGMMILKRLVSIANEKDGRSISLNARMHAVGFYQKAGFTSVGEAFRSKRTGVEHIEMRREI